MRNIRKLAAWLALLTVLFVPMSLGALGEDGGGAPELEILEPEAELLEPAGEEASLLETEEAAPTEEPEDVFEAASP